MLVRNVLLSIFLFGAFASSPAQVGQSLPSKQWQTIARLVPGSMIVVRENASTVPTLCALAWIDNTTLACDSLYPPENHDGLPNAATSPVRLIYNSVSVFWVVPAQSTVNNARSETHVRALCVGMAVGGVFGGLVARDLGVRAGFVFAGLGAATGGGLALAATGAYESRPYPLWSFHVSQARHP